jgi:transcriptional regulator with XRE-family HTH domain
MDIGLVIKKLRETNSLSQPELAFRLGISQTTLCNIECGRNKKVDFLLIDKICREFNVGFDCFLSKNSS